MSRLTDDMLKIIQRFFEESGCPLTPEQMAILSPEVVRWGAATAGSTVTADQQAMWDAMTILGQDTDGDKTPAHVLAGTNDKGFRSMFLAFVSDARREHDEAVDEVCMAPDDHRQLPIIKAAAEQAVRDGEAIAAMNVEATWPLNLAEPEGGPDDGHTFEFVMRSRGSYSVRGEEGHHDAAWMPDPLWGIRVRAWSLRDALRNLVAVPMAEWTRHLREDEES